MLEGRLVEGHILKKVVDAIKDLCKEVNFDCNERGIQMQAMDGSHVSLVCMMLKSVGFEHFRCDRPTSLGLNMESMAKVFRMCGSDDTLSLRKEEDANVVTLAFEKDEDRMSNFELKLMDLSAVELGIPEKESQAVVTMPAGEFQRICRDLSVFGETVIIDVTKDAVKFEVSGDIGSGNVTLRSGCTPGGASSSKKSAKETKEVKEAQEIKDEPKDEAKEEEATDEAKDEAKEEAKEEDDEVKEEAPPAKRQRSEGKNEAKASADGTVVLDVTEPVRLAFALRYFNNFAKATPLSNKVTITLHKERPILIEYPLHDKQSNDLGHLAFYLAPRIDGDEN